MNEPEPEHIINDHDPVKEDTNLIGTSAASSPSAAAPKKEDTNLIGTSAASSPSAAAPKKEDTNLIGTEQIVPSSDVLNKQAALANAASADANVAEYKKAIAILNELLNKLKSDLETAPANVEDIEHAIEIGTKLLNKLNAAIGTPAPVAADVTDVPDANGVPVVTGAPDANGAAGPCGGVRASLLSSVDPSCYIAPDLPPLAQMIQAAFANEISTAGREIVMNFLKAAGIQGVESAILTPETINQLDVLSKDPKMKTKIEALQANLDNVAGQAVTGIENNVEPKLEKVVGEVEANAVGGLGNALADIPLVGDIEAAGQEAKAISQVGEQIPAIGNEISAELAPLKALTGEVDAVTSGLPKVPSLPSITPPVLPSITPPVLPSITPPSLTVPEAPSITVPEAPSITVPEAPSITVPEAPSITVPEAPSITVPEAPSITVPEAPSITVDGDAIKPITDEEQARADDEARAAHSAKIDAQLQEAKAASEAKRLQKMDAQPTASTGLKMQSGPGVGMQQITPEKQGISVPGGSSRKRRRIHKLSRRIERTLRRVHRLKGDKNSFLRRTINANKMK